ncbi:hypothetical protein HPB50_011007 [Hyalomma asiaticum]|uniref:Uncharacterized protein n=1 Tax=Hyalomma asiaticum TaxID=266040 RepID=A0ACB7S2V4_HYAAI|nr:hypothetical protein HPB50_011007 [Hyalomma asiaticum]
MVLTKRRKRLLLLKKKVLLAQKMLEDQRQRRWWVRPSWRTRHAESEFFTTMKKMRAGDIEYFKKYYRMSPSQFDYILSLVNEDLERETLIREPISSAERLAMTLRYLSSGALMQDIALSFRVGISTAREAVQETCVALWSRLKPMYMPKPKTETWLHIAEGFSRTWQFPNCIGAVDGKHIQIKCPPNSGSMYFNYKGTYSIVLLAVVDSDYKFVIVDVGAYGKQSDGGVLEQSKFGRRLEDGKLYLPRDLDLPNTQTVVDPFKMYKQRGKFWWMSFCMWSCKWRCAENAFGILVTRWRILARTMGEEPKQAEKMVKALCALHNFLMHRGTANEDAYCGPGFADSVDGFGQQRSGHWRDLLAQPPMQVARTQARHFAQAARQVRGLYAHYFYSAVGKVPWQDKIWCPVNTGPNAALPAAQ